MANEQAGLKQLFEINNFEQGTWYSPDDRDIPDNAAVYSENVDPYGQSGSLQAIHTDATPIISGVDANRMVLIENGDNDEDASIVYVDKSDGDIKQVKELYAGAGNVEIATLETNDIPSTTIPAMALNNKEVHIGLGQLKEPKWVGIIPHGQFGGSAPVGLQIDKAKLAGTSDFPPFHKVVGETNNTTLYGIAFEGNYIYKLDVATSTLDIRSEYVFVKTIAMCRSTDNNHLFVIDKVSSSKIAIVKIDKLTLNIVTFTQVSDFTGDTSVTDCLQMGNHLWVAIGGDYNAATGYYLWACSTADIINGGTLSFTNKTPYPGAAADSNTGLGQGAWLPAQADPNDYDVNANQILPTFKIPDICLVEDNSSTTVVGVFFIAQDHDGTGNVAHLSHGTDITNANFRTAATYYLQLVSSSITAGEKLDDNSGRGKIFGFSDAVLAGTPITRDKIFSVHSTAYSSKLTISYQGNNSGDVANTTNVSSLAKIEFNTGSSSLISTKVVEGTIIDISKAFTLDATVSSAANFNMLSGDSTSLDRKWAGGTTGSIAVKMQSLSSLIFNASTDESGTMTTSQGTRFYGVTFTYDGYQESPLTTWWKNTATINSSNKSINVTIDLMPAVLSKRVSHVNLYCSTSSGSSNIPNTFFRLVKSVSLKVGWLQTATNTNNPNWGTFYSKTIHDLGLSGATYESRTGLSEVLTDTLPKYGLSASLNGFLFIGDCKTVIIDDATNFIFKSRPFNYDQFNLARDFLILPQKPVALEVFNGRLYAFGKNETYVINPDSMFIEDTLIGIGALNQNTVKATQSGMCFADKNNVYFHNGSQIQPIGDRIKTAEQVDSLFNTYTQLSNVLNTGTSITQTIVIGYDYYRSAFLFFFSFSNPLANQKHCFTWAYTLPKKRWDLWKRSHASGSTNDLKVYATITGKHGELLTSDSESGLIEPFSPTSSARVSDLLWYSKKFTFGSSTGDKKILETRGSSEDSTSVTVTANTDSNSSTYNSITYGRIGKHIQLKVAIANDATAIIDSVGFVFRNLRSIKKF